MTGTTCARERRAEKQRDGRTRATNRRPGRRAFVLTAVAVALAACSAAGRSGVGGASSPTVASLGSSGAPAGDSSTTTLPNGADATRLVDAWASCMRSHGDPNQVDPTIDTHGVINITIGAGASQALASEVKGGTDKQTGTCSQYLSAAQRALREAFPVSPPPSNSALLNYASCMRANGVPTYPDPTTEKMNLSGIDTNSPTFLRANDICGKKIDAPAWWLNGWGPPGDISVRSCFDGAQTIACPSGFPPSGETNASPGSDSGG